MKKRIRLLLLSLFCAMTIVSSGKVFAMEQGKENVSKKETGEKSQETSEKSDDKKEVSKKQNCAICNEVEIPTEEELKNFDDEEKEKFMRLSECGHVFCKKCLKDRANGNDEERELCPVCKKNYKEYKQLLDGFFTRLGKKFSRGKEKVVAKVTGACSALKKGITRPRNICLLIAGMILGVITWKPVVGKIGLNAILATGSVGLEVLKVVGPFILKVLLGGLRLTGAVITGFFQLIFGIINLILTGTFVSAAALFILFGTGQAKIINKKALLSNQRQFGLEVFGNTLFQTDWIDCTEAEAGWHLLMGRELRARWVVFKGELTSAFGL